ncbi:hypothetical protein SAMD00019534_015590 [Acytostelium subglobosum LB1]|uniref:hypothetical protein n=1 Tax=Acytostelium subglobosum LB1 TaxID=1410327 RepID=UPI000645083D|nr:hypothetical protein SAMD00019534_015590 [Acytostelium subglobosum LB1]GAM18384.1 hypothetical protein SAMD00019534_015590 [Acytostelium subglobosum LB1]|eukprot:XP_012757604.1 hypothetical protein SAMD00019534_015590 [Acytostelium subglobosum LB1]
MSDEHQQQQQQNHNEHMSEEHQHQHQQAQQENENEQVHKDDDTSSPVATEPIIEIKDKDELLTEDGKEKRLCKHRGSCLHSCLRIWMRGLLIGYGMRATLALLSALFVRRLYKNPRKLINQSLLHKEPIGFGLFVAFYTGGFRAINCFLRNVRGKEDGWNSAIAGFFAGSAMMFSKSTEMALYLFARALESLFNAAHKRGYVGSWKHGDSALFCFSTTMMFYAFVWEPKTLRPSYWKFLTKVAGKGLDLATTTAKMREMYYVSRGLPVPIDL